jgi:hypothetical protein
VSRQAAREHPELCVEPLGVLNALVASFEPQALLGEDAANVASMQSFFTSLCTPELAQVAALSADLTESALVPGALTGLAR